jgi:hypothetical protein
MMAALVGIDNIFYLDKPVSGTPFRLPWSRACGMSETSCTELFGLFE